MAEGYTLYTSPCIKKDPLQNEILGEKPEELGATCLILPQRRERQTLFGKGPSRRFQSPTRQYSTLIRKSIILKRTLLPLITSLEKRQKFVQRHCGTSAVGGVQDLTGHDPEQADLTRLLSCRASRGPFQPGVLCDSACKAQ